MARSLCIVILVTFSIVASSAIDCNNKGCSLRGHRHTMCVYPDPNPAQACGKVLSLGLTNDDKQEIVDLHNQHRSFVAQGSEQRGKPGPQPPASNMQDLVWDDELAEIAQRWANQCIFAYDEYRDVDRFWVGQLLGMGTTNGIVLFKLSDMVNMWYKEVKDFDRNEVSRFTNAVNAVGYSQVVWANTNRIGCGKIVYQPNSSDIKYYWVVCNYGPGGNIVGEPVYLIKQ